MKKWSENFHDRFFSESVAQWVYRFWLFAIGAIIVEVVLKWLA